MPDGGAGRCSAAGCTAGGAGGGQGGDFGGGGAAGTVVVEFETAVIKKNKI